MNEKIIHFDRETEKWLAQHPDAETTIMRCEKCGLYYKPSLGHKCRRKEVRGHAAD